jgi:putative flippase GtrA
MQKVLAVIRQMGRVGMSSLIALCVDVGVFLSILPMVSYAAVAAMVGHACGIIAHYAVSSRLTLKSELSHVSGVRAEAQALTRFFAAGGSGMVVTTIVIYVMIDRLGFHPLIGKGVAVGASFFTVFMMLRILVLRDQPTPFSLQSAES